MLRYAFVVFAGATILSVLLPARADATAGELPVTLSGDRKKFRVPPDVVFALRCNAGLRMLSGFLTMFMAFLLRQHPLPGWEGQTTLLMGLVIGAAGLGNAIGIGLGSVLRRITPSVTVVVALLADATAAVVAAVFYGLIPAIALGLTAGVAQAMGKISLDATIQRDVPERNRTSAFARSETLLQLSWVVGGGIGIALPLIPKLGLGVLAGLMVLWTMFVLVRRPQQGPPRAQPRPLRSSWRARGRARRRGRGAAWPWAWRSWPRGGDRRGSRARLPRGAGSGPRRCRPSPRASCAGPRDGSG